MNNQKNDNFMPNLTSDNMEVENLIFAVDNLLGPSVQSGQTTQNENKSTNIDSYYVRYKLGIEETDLDSMCPQEKLDFCDFISKWRWGTSGSFFIGCPEKLNNEHQTILNVESDIAYLSKKFPYKIIVYFAGESSCDYCSKVFFAGVCEKFTSIPAVEINQLLYRYGISLRPLEIFYRDPEFVDLDCIDICEF